ncbi:hypothetical protein ASPBRDRAFT_669514 [Aspergillus brasiliensis CBS 101740]|uniref:Uncharacterized protein n=1 Tax=Aspergillus brasiliensis (strain CBS 101740 / IMI 381727 / IBT 21946) TaxID=767769 RepID=A0A1L9U273_ASPBC|nr:hypothetical protein ASPBRDRAFT_669514 [Aspergillus brasiliensis CBS 101740]
MLLNSILECIFGTLVNGPLPLPDPRSAAAASNIVTKILNADTPYSLHKQLNEEVSTNGWTNAIAQATLHGLDNAIGAGAEMAQAASDAAAQSKHAAIGFARDHPVYATLIALGI